MATAKISRRDRETYQVHKTEDGWRASCPQCDRWATAESQGQALEDIQRHETRHFRRYDQ